MESIVLSSAEQCMRFLDGELVEISVSVKQDLKDQSETQVTVICRQEGSCDRRYIGKIIDSRKIKNLAVGFPLTLLTIQKV